MAPRGAAAIALAAAAAAIALAASGCRRPADPAAAAAARTAPDPSRPNVLMIVIDTTRADRCSLLGYDRETTPALAAFAKDAVTFDDVWSQGSWTVPAHASLFTGMDPGHLDWFHGLDAKLRDSVTLAERLRAAGWDTAAFSANPWVAPVTGLTRGFDTVRPLFHSEVELASSREVDDSALAWINGRADPGRPFFAFLNVMEPHSPYNPGPEETARLVRPQHEAGVLAEARTLDSRKKLIDCSIRGVALDPKIDAAISDLYDAEIAGADAQLGRFLAQLKSSGILDHTLVVIVSDHGEGLGDHGWREHGLRLNRELLRVPLVVRYPGKFDGGRRVRSLVCVEDVTPTVLACCGVPEGAPLDGRDLAGRLARDEPGGLAFATDRPYAGFPMLGAADLPPDVRKSLEMRRYSVCDGKHHLIVDDAGGAELYDVTADPRELRNLATAQPDVLERLRAELRTMYGIR